MKRDRMEFELDELRPDTELTLGPAMLAGLVCGLLLLCGACFGVGYSLGRHSGRTVAAAAQPANTETSAEQPVSSQAKPQAKGTVPAAPAISAPAAQIPAAAPSPLASNAPVSTAPSAPATPSLVHPALQQPATVQAATTILPAAPANGPMVQIAAVSHAEDADVLMNALRKHGYAVTARRMPGDGLIHVRIGPFATRAEANAMSLKLLGDGYNAVVLP
ncbi:MAG TPA: SPOR domain-containing protein [Terracidiphilus sp.]|jgi:cell division septation protein DedD|nr:SPOR domain-containing protein [Terracidiphilus sp.]